MSGKHLAIWIWSSQRCQGGRHRCVGCWTSPWVFILIPYLLRSSREAARLIVGTQIMAFTFQQEGGSDLSSFKEWQLLFLSCVSSSMASYNLQVTPKCGPWGVLVLWRAEGGGPSFQLHWYFIQSGLLQRSCLNRFLLFKMWYERNLAYSHFPLYLASLLSVKGNWGSEKWNSSDFPGSTSRPGSSIYSREQLKSGAARGPFLSRRIPPFIPEMWACFPSLAGACVCCCCCC